MLVHGSSGRGVKGSPEELVEADEFRAAQGQRINLYAAQKPPPIPRTIPAAVEKNQPKLSRWFLFPSLLRPNTACQPAGAFNHEIH